MTTIAWYAYSPTNLSRCNAGEVEALVDADAHALDDDDPLRAEYVVTVEQ